MRTKYIVYRCMSLFFTAVLLFLLSGCDKLTDSDVTADTLAGRWSFSYTTSTPIDYELSYNTVIFQSDGNCALTYTDGQLEGTFQASQDLIRITTLVDGRERILLWRILTLSPDKIVAYYDHEMNDGSTITMTVTLERLSYS